MEERRALRGAGARGVVATGRGSALPLSPIDPARRDVADGQHDPRALDVLKSSSAKTRQKRLARRRVVAVYAQIECEFHAQGVS